MFRNKCVIRSSTYPTTLTTIKSSGFDLQPTLAVLQAADSEALVLILREDDGLR